MMLDESKLNSLRKPLLHYNLRCCQGLFITKLIWGRLVVASARGAKVTTARNASFAMTWKSTVDQTGKNRPAWWGGANGRNGPERHLMTRSQSASYPERVVAAQSGSRLNLMAFCNFSVPRLALMTMRRPVLGSFRKAVETKQLVKKGHKTELCPNVQQWLYQCRLVRGQLCFWSIIVVRRRGPVPWEGCRPRGKYR